jgi:hypothetical protein
MLKSLVLLVTTVLCMINIHNLKDPVVHRFFLELLMEVNYRKTALYWFVSRTEILVSEGSTC